MDTLTRRFGLAAAVVATAVAGTIAQAPPARHRLTLDDVERIREVRDPQCSPDGSTVAFVVSAIDKANDKIVSHVWRAGRDGVGERQLTWSDAGESTPRWSPDGKYLSFTSSRPGPANGAQVWVLDRSGGEAVQLTSVKGRLQAYDWSPDSKRLALVVADPDPDAEPVAPGAKPKAPWPIVIDRYRFKSDLAGYLLSDRHSYIYLFDLATKKDERLTNGSWDESLPSWSPDGTRIAFMSNHEQDPDREPSAAVYVADAKPGAAARAVTPDIGARQSRPGWSPDGKTIAFLEADEKKWDAYGMNHLAIVPADGSRPPERVRATEDLDRGVSSPRFTPDGASIAFLVTDDRSVYPARVDVAGRRVDRLLAPPVVVSNWSAAGACSAVLSGRDDQMTEVYAFDGGALKQISHQNDPLEATLQLAHTEEVSFKSKDGTEVHGLLTEAVGYTAGARVPFLLRIHGGPNGQDQHAFSTERQLFAANGYAVLAVNYRGSAGRGMKYSRAIFADWGHYEVEDLEAGVEYAIHRGIADPDRLGVGGWSYGGILTDYMIATDRRFKAATSGAGTAFTVAFYGTDQYIIQYDYEIGPPWNPKSWEIYQKISYPFLHADRIATPTLFLGGEKDFNVPVQGGQQMYEALRSLGIPAELVIYPNEHHGIARPSYVRDRYERYLAWYAKYLKPSSGRVTSAPR